MDAVQQADSGHPGTAMALAPLAYVLWQRHLRYHPAHPDWFGRDRFVLSAGHAFMLLYAVLYLTGYDLSLDDIKQFRQWGSRTPGHSEHGLTPGVEATTGPLGQGVGNAVGMALAEAHLAQLFNRPGHTIVDHCTYFLASDGDLMEGVSHEACSLAGHLKLGRLIGCTTTIASPSTARPISRSRTTRPNRTVSADLSGARVDGGERSTRSEGAS